jgi:hypothetical protein
MRSACGSRGRARRRPHSDPRASCRDRPTFDSASTKFEHSHPSGSWLRHLLFGRRSGRRRRRAWTTKRADHRMLSRSTEAMGGTRDGLEPAPRWRAGGSSRRGGHCDRRGLAGVGDAHPASLSSGGPGIALFFAYLGRARPHQEHQERAHRLLDDAFDAVATRPLSASLFGGFTGVAWTAEHLTGDVDGDAAHLDGSVEEVDAPGEDDPNASVDDALLDLLAQSPWRPDAAGPRRSDGRRRRWSAVPRQGARSPPGVRTPRRR